MAQTLLTPSIITKEALGVLHQECKFIKKIDRQYDKSFGKTGAKIGSTLKIRKPNEFTVRTGAAIAVQDIEEESLDLTVATQKGVDFTFPTTDLTLTIDEFAARYLRPALSVLASHIENDALSMYKDVANFYDGVSSADSFANLTQAGKLLDDNLAPDSDRCGLLGTQSTVDVLADTKGLFAPQSAIGKQYTSGALGNIAGFDLMTSTLTPGHTCGSSAEGDSTYNVNGTSQSGSSLVVDGGTATFLKGDIITIAGCNAVHPETKVSTGVLKRFVVTADSGASATTLSISPAIVLTGGRQNVSAAPTDNGAVSKIGGGDGATWKQSLYFHKSAFTFVAADLEDVGSFGAWTSRDTLDGLSMRITRQYDINTDKVPARIDVLYGYKAVRPELAVRVGHNS